MFRLAQDVDVGILADASGTSVARVWSQDSGRNKTSENNCRRCVCLRLARWKLEILDLGLAFLKMFAESFCRCVLGTSLDPEAYAMLLQRALGFGLV